MRLMWTVEKSPFNTGEDWVEAIWRDLELQFAPYAVYWTDIHMTGKEDSTIKGKC